MAEVEMAAAEMAVGVELDHSERRSATQPPPDERRRRRRAADFLGGVLAMLLLPLSIAPVLLLGPSVLRAPVALAHEGWGDVQRLERDLRPARGARPVGDPVALRELPAVSLGSVYGRWSAFPEAGRTRAGDPLLGPEDPVR
jgi:hypothetical protein